MFTCPHCGQKLMIVMDEAGTLSHEALEILARPPRIVPVQETRFDAPHNGVGRPVELPEGTAFFVDRGAIARRRDEILHSKEKKS